MTKRHTTHFDDCGCLTLRYKIVINALTAIKAHWDVVIGGGKKFSAVSHMLDKAFEDLQKLDNDGEEGRNHE